ncbi:unnamed protein product [Arctogadus glacialis]
MPSNPNLQPRSHSAFSNLSTNLRCHREYLLTKAENLSTNVPNCGDKEESLCPIPPPDEWVGGEIKWHYTESSGEAHKRKTQHMRLIPGRCDVWFAHQKAAHNPLLSILPDVWEGSKVSISGAGKL